MSKKEIAKRYIMFIFCLFFMGIGVALTKHGELGISPVSSVANVISCKFTFISFGTWLTISNCMMVLVQILLLRRNFKPIQLLQIPLSFLFGYFTDLGSWLVAGIPNDIYVVRILLVLGGVVVIAFGICLGIIANVMLNSGEAMVKAIADVTKKDFGTVKVIFDVSWVTLSVILSLIFFNGKLIGTREGTLIAAVTLGFVVKFIKPLIDKPLTKLLTK